MGIKDWFSGDKNLKDLFRGDKKREELRDKVKDAVSDGNLSDTDMLEIQQLQEALGVSDAADDKTVFRRAIFDEALSAVKDKGQLSATGVHDLAKIQKFLGLRDDQLEREKFELARLRTLSEVRKGNLPVVSASNVALRGVKLESEEVAHYSLAIDLFGQSSTRQADGVALLPNQAYEADSSKGHMLPEAGAKPLGEGNLILTNRRLILKTPKGIAAMKYRDAQIFLYSDGLRLQRSVGNTLLKFKSGSDETAEIVGELIGSLTNSAGY